MNAEVCIIGGGPAGLSCGIWLARRGIKSVIFEKNRFPFRKVCGEICSPKAVQELKDIGVPVNDFLKVERIEVFTRAHSLEFNLGKNECRMIPRDSLSVKMLEIAREKGVEVREGEKVVEVEKEGRNWKVITEKGEFTCRVLIGADGVSSIVRRRIFRFAPRSKDIAVGVRGIFRDSEVDALQFYLFEATMPGYLWKFPLGDSLVNVGLGIRADVMKKKNLTPVEVFKKLDRENGILGKGAEEVIPFQVHPIYLGSHIGETVKEDAVLVGESAGFVNPFTGEGIFYALKSGRIAGEVVADYLKGKRNLFDFDFRWRREFGFGLVLSKVYQRVATEKRIDKILKFSYEDERVRETIFESLLGSPRLRIPVYLKILLRR